MIWLYVGRRVLRRAWVVLLAAVLAGGVLIAHPQTRLQQALDSRGAFGGGLHHLERQLQHGLEQHLRPPGERRTPHPQRVERSGSR
jgi:hypothetical protein